MFDPKQSENKLNVFGKEFTQVLGDGGSNKQGNTKVFATETLSTQDIFNYAQSLTGGKPLVEIPTAPGRYYAVLDSGATINLRNVSRSADETKARWTIEIKGNEQLEALQGKVKKRIEIKFR
jgi:filamentous hemagglutinin